MADIHSTTGTNTDSSEARSVIATSAGFVRVELSIFAGKYVDQWEARIRYEGQPAALIASGCATADMIAPRRGGGRRRDAQGHEFLRCPGRHSFVLWRYWPADRAHELPGVRAAVVAELVRNWKQNEAEADRKQAERDRKATESRTIMEDLRRPLGPEEWRGKRLNALKFFMDQIADLADCESTTHFELAAGFNADAATMQLYMQRALAASKELEAILAGMEIRPVRAAALRLVVDNT